MIDEMNMKKCGHGELRKRELARRKDVHICIAVRHYVKVQQAVGTSQNVF